MKKDILIQARMTSRRFPKKMMRSLGGVPLVEFVYKRCSKSSKAQTVAVITSCDTTDNELFDYCIKHKIEVFRGPLDNVLERYIRASEFYNSEIICRVCGDSPFVDVALIDRMFEIIEKDKLDYVAPKKENCIVGLDSEVVTIGALKKSSGSVTTSDETEHVTSYIRNNADGFKVKFIEIDLKPKGLNDVRLTVDTADDLSLCNKIAGFLKTGYSFSSSDIFSVLFDKMKL